MVFDHRSSGNDTTSAFGASYQNALVRDAGLLPPRVVTPVLETTHNPDQFHPSKLVASNEYDLPETFNLRIGLRRALIFMRDVYGTAALDGIGGTIVSPEQIRGAIDVWHQMFQPGISQQEQQRLNAGLTERFQEMFQACIGSARGDRGQMLANLELLRRSLNHGFQAADSRFSFDHLQLAVDTEGRIHTALPITIDSRPTGIVRRLPVIVPPQPESYTA